jgi:hypothetical protein
MPEWALLELQALSTLSRGPELLKDYLTEDGEILWPECVKDFQTFAYSNVDNAFEGFQNFPLLYMLGGDDALLQYSQHEYDALVRQFSSRKKHDLGIDEKEAERLGVPAEKILIDPKGYSTYESIVNLLQQYKGKRVLIVTQKYHLYRALYIAEKNGIDAYGVSADLRTYRKQAQYDLREILARVKDVLWVQYNLK